MSTLLVAALLAAEPAAAEKPGATGETAALLQGKLPDGAGKAVLQAKCLICHSDDYVTQQRLTPGQWQKTVEKMRKLGAPLTDDEVKTLSDYLGRSWTLELPERTVRPVKPPAGSLPGR